MLGNTVDVQFDFSAKHLLHQKVQDVVKPVVTLKFDRCAKTKDELLPKKIILIVHILPLPNGILEDCGLGDKMRFEELDILRNHDQGGHVVLRLRECRGLGPQICI
jgi:hypothetical protein